MTEPPDFERLFRSIARTAVHLEMRDDYGGSSPAFAAWRERRPYDRTPTTCGSSAKTSAALGTANRETTARTGSTSSKRWPGRTTGEPRPPATATASSGPGSACPGKAPSHRHGPTCKPPGPGRSRAGRPRQTRPTSTAPKRGLAIHGDVIRPAAASAVVGG